MITYRFSLSISAQWRSICWFSLIFVFLLVGGVVFAKPAEAATLVVTTTTDDGDGTCTEVKCTYRDAIAVHSTGDTVDLTHLPGLPTPQTITLDTHVGDVQSFESMTLIGPGATELTITTPGGVGDPLMLLSSGGCPGTAVYTVSGITFSGGPVAALCSTASLSDITLTGVNVTLNNFAMAVTNSKITMDHMHFVGNTGTIGTFEGGELSLEADDWTLTNSYFTNNADPQITITNDNGPGYLANVTIKENIATEGRATVENSVAQSVAMTNVTLVASTGATAALSATDGTITATNSVVSGGCTTSGSGTITDGGHNIDDGNTCGFSTHDTDPLLNVMADNGGSTLTASLRAESPAIDGGDNLVCAAALVNSVDQRGIVRPQGLTCDIGAFEYVPPAPTPTVTSVTGQNPETTAGGKSITINGTNFVATPTATVGGTAATAVTLVSSTELTAIAPATTTAGTYNVVVTNPDTQTGTCAGCMTYTAPPTVSSINPSSVTTAGGPTLTITGTGMKVGTNGAKVDTTSVTTGGTATAATFTAPAHAAGAVVIRVYGTEGTDDNGIYTDTSSGFLTYVTPHSGGRGGGGCSPGFYLNPSKMACVQTAAVVIPPPTPPAPPTTSPVPSVNTGHATSTVPVFTRDLKLGMTGSGVLALQQYLNIHGFIVNTNPIGPGSPGHETSKFGALTRAAVIKFQKVNNITPAVGYFGPLTRAKMNQVYDR